MLAEFAHRQPLELHVARLGFGLTSHVKAGENSGRKLEHDFVVLALENAPLTDGQGTLTLPGLTTPGAGRGRQALVAWVTEPGQLAPLQVVGGWLP